MWYVVVALMLGYTTISPKIDINKYICTGLNMCREKASATVHIVPSLALKKKKKTRTPIVSHSHQKKQTFGMYLLCILFCYYKNAESRFLSCRSFISASEGSTSSFPEMVPLSVPTDTTIQRMTTHSESI